LGKEEFGQEGPRREGFRVFKTTIYRRWYRKETCPVREERFAIADRFIMGN
jgi:hypothetical protein